MPNGNENDTAAEVTEGVADLNLRDTASANDPDDQQTLSTADVNSLLDKCLLQALHTTVKDKDLPLPGSTLWWDSLSLFASWLTKLNHLK